MKSDFTPEMKARWKEQRAEIKNQLRELILGEGSIFELFESR